MNLRKVNEEVFIAEDAIVQFDSAAVAFAKAKAFASPRGRARICAHKSTDDALHEMLIAISEQSYIHPHKHVSKTESFHVIEGVVDVVILNDSGMVESIVELGQPGTGLPFYYRLAAPQFHTLLLRTPWLVVHEITTGPFRPEQTVLAPFAPAETEVAAVASYRASLAMHVAHLRR